MRDKLEAIKAEALAKIESAEVVSTLNDVKVAILGKKGELTQVLKSMKDVAPEDRPKVGQMVNEARQAIETALDEKTKAINRALRAEKMKRETIDVTLPGYILCYKGYPPSYTDITCSGKNHGEGQSSYKNPLTWTSIQS